jgi:DHA1 family bicyclomycin/chloramphenicol resistance-like MFS transporter
MCPGKKFAPRLPGIMFGPMLQKKETNAAASPADMGFPEFVTLMALMMGLTALAVDIMLPALGEIGKAVSLDEPNHRQLVITYYLFGFAFGQIVFGPISDHIGRKKPLAAGLAVFIIADIVALFAADATVLFAARAAQGIGAAAPRVIALAIIRDRYAGRQMARVMSFVIMVFIVVPILAPMIGQSVMQFMAWRGVFGVLLLVALATLVWSGLRLRETASTAEPPIPLANAARAIVTSRQTVGYAVGFGFFFGILMSYVGSSEQIFIDVYQLGDAFPLVFAAVASVMILASFLNSRLVLWLGMRRVSHYALLGFVAVCGLMALAGYPERPPLLVFCLFMMATFFCFGLIGPNFNALAMEPMGRIAGTASSFIGFYTTAAGACFGWVVGQSFDGSVRPLTIGFTVLAVSALIAVLITERFQLGRVSQLPS